jgi:predicted nucleic acid-binding protein
VIAYLDSSILARAYLADEEGHEHAAALLEDPQTALVTGTWTRIEVSGALIRAARSGRGDADGLLALLDADLGTDGPVTLLGVEQERVEERALGLVREHALRALDAWHLAVASLTVPALAEPGEEIAFASRDEAQAKVAGLLGFSRI